MTAVITRLTMSPTILRDRGYRFYFFSREEPRMHVHVQGAASEAKFWLEPRVELAQNFGMDPRSLRIAKAIVEDNSDVFRDAWNRYFTR